MKAVDSLQYSVRVMFGQHAISRYRGDQPHAERYRAAMERRFPSLQVVSEPPLPALPGVRVQ